MTIPRVRLACISSALATVLLIGTASDHSPDHSVSVRQAPESIPESSLSVAFSAGSQPTTPPCRPRGSLRPHGPLPEPGRMPPDSTMARIAERGRLIVAVGPETLLINFRDFKPGGLKGFDIDIAGDIAEAIFADRERVEYRQLNLSDRLAAVKSNEVDLVISTTTITCRRQATLEFSTVYYEAGQRVLVHRDSPVTGLDDLAAKRVCAARGSTSLQNVLTTRSRPVPVGVPSVTDCLVMLQLGEVDAVSTDDTLLAGLAAQDPQTKIVGPRVSSEPYGVVINPAATDLVRFVNAVLERRVADGRWLAGYQRWLQDALGPPSIPKPQYRD